MENVIKISIIIPIYNAEKYLKKCLDSIAAQTMKNFEVVLINDGSQDGSQKIIDEFAASGICRVECKQKENAGQAAARNDGLAMATGEYVAFMDSDDYLESDYLERLYQAAKKYDSESVTCGYSMVDDKGKLIRKVQLSENGAIPYGRAGMYVVWCRLYKREFLIKNGFAFQTGGKIYEDVPYSIAAKFLSRNPVVIDYEGYYYVQHPGSTMSSGTVKSGRFPFEKMTEAVELSLKAAEGANAQTVMTGAGQAVPSEMDMDKKNRLEFEVLHFFAGFFFRYCRKADKKDIDVLVNYARELIQTYFPKYYKNPLVGICRNKQQPFVDRVAVRMLVWTNRLGLLGTFVKLVTRF